MPFMASDLPLPRRRLHPTPKNREIEACPHHAIRPDENGRSIMSFKQMPLWLIPMLYAAGAFLAATTVPRFEHILLASNASGLSISSAQSFFAAAASGMIALTGIVFSVGLVMVQFSAMAYSPRLVLMFARDPMLFHSLGVFIATFLYSLGALAWVDRERSGIIAHFSQASWLFPCCCSACCCSPSDKGTERPSDHKRASSPRGSGT